MKKIEVFCGILEDNNTREHDFVFWIILRGIYYRTSFLQYCLPKRNTNKRGSLKYNLFNRVTFTTHHGTYEELVEEIERPRFPIINHGSKILKVNKFSVSLKLLKESISRYCKEGKTFVILNNEILNYMKEKELKEALKELDVFVDFGNGDKFKVEPDEIDIEHKRLIFKGSQGQIRWVKIDERYGQK